MYRNYTIYIAPDDCKDLKEYINALVDIQNFIIENKFKIQNMCSYGSTEIEIRGRKKINTAREISPIEHVIVRNENEDDIDGEDMRRYR